MRQKRVTEAKETYYEAHSIAGARSFARSPSPRHPPLTQYPLPPRPLSRGGKASPHRLSEDLRIISYTLGSTYPMAHVL